MKGKIKDLLKISGVRGYAIANRRKIQIKIPVEYRSSDLKERIKNLYSDINKNEKKPGDVIEVYMEDLVITIFLNKVLMMMVISDKTTNLNLLRIIGKLVIANIAKDKGL